MPSECMKENVEGLLTFREYVGGIREQALRSIDYLYRVSMYGRETSWRQSQVSQFLCTSPSVFMKETLSIRGDSIAGISTVNGSLLFMYLPFFYVSIELGVRTSSQSSVYKTAFCHLLDILRIFAGALLSKPLAVLQHNKEC